MKRKLEILNAVKNKKLHKFEFTVDDCDFVLQIIDNYLAENDFKSVMYLKKHFEIKEPESISDPNRIVGEVETIEEIQYNKNLKIFYKYRNKIENKIKNKIINGLENNEIEINYNFLEIIYPKEEEYKDYVSVLYEIIIKGLIEYLIQRQNLLSLYTVFSYLVNNFTTDYDETIARMFKLFFENKNNNIYPKFQKSILVWYNDYVSDVTITDKIFFDLLFEYDIPLAVKIFQEALCINNDLIKNEDILVNVLSELDFFHYRLNKSQKIKFAEELLKVAFQSENSKLFAFLLTFSINYNLNDTQLILKKINEKKLMNDVIDTVCETYLIHKDHFPILNSSERVKIADFLMTQNLGNINNLKIVTQKIKTQTETTLQENIFLLSKDIRKFYNLLISGINSFTVKKKYKKEIKYLLLLLIRFYDSNFDLEDRGTLKTACNHLFNLNVNKNNIEYFYSRKFENIYRNTIEMEKLGIKDDALHLYEMQIKKDYFGFWVFERIFRKINELSELENDKLNFYIGFIQNLYHSLQIYTKKIKEINFIVKKQKEIEKARIKERERIMATLSHLLKNMLATVIDPLENMKQNQEYNPVVISNALRGANLIRQIVNAMNLSLMGTINDFQYDAIHNKGKDAKPVEMIFVEALKYSISNMFDGKYFSNFVRQYFPEKEEFLKAKSAWEQISQTTKSDEIVSFLHKYFFQTEFEFNDAKNIIIGNEKNSAIKMLILIQEMIFNAVKYSSFVPKKKRILKIYFNKTPENVSIKVENRFVPGIKTKTTGLGSAIINNFAEMLKTRAIIKTQDENYSLEIKFKNFWKE